MPTIANDGWEYEVKEGDTLWSIAERYLLETALWRKLRDLNKVPDPYRLKPGSALAIPLEWLRTNPAAAAITAVSGAATIANGRDGTSIRAVAGARLQTGDTLATTPEANVTLNFDDGSRLLLLSDSELQFV
ncbi:MAG: LysM peptidoglycan-binding domain-containing protein [Burkholderiales bacterium]